MRERGFSQVDVFSDTAYAGNPLAVVLDGTGLDDAAMQRFANWTHLSETTFVLPAEDPAADYRLRIFTTERELPFAGHPTLGSCHAWLTAGNRPKRDDGVVVQECGAGLIEMRRIDGRLAFAAPPLIRSGPVDEPTMTMLAEDLRIDRSTIVDAQWVDNGPGWVAVLLSDADTVLAVRPGAVRQDIGVVGPYPSGAPAAFEVRALIPHGGSTVEDPVTGSLNAGLAGWLLASGRATAPYVASQGTVLGRAGRVYVSKPDDSGIWVGGGTTTFVAGTVEL